LLTRFLQWGCLLSVVAGIFCPVASFAADEAPAKDCRLKQLAAIDIQMGTYPLVPVVINGTPALMALRSTFPLSMILRQSAKELNLALGRVPGRVNSALSLYRFKWCGLEFLDHCVRLRH